MRRYCCLIALFALLLGPVPAVHAGDAASEDPGYAAESLILTEADLPSPWKLGELGEDMPAGLPSEDDITGIAGADVDTFDVGIEHRPIKGPAGEDLVLAVLDVDLDDPVPFLSALKSAAAAKAWRLSELGNRRRIMLVAGPEEIAKKLESIQRDAAASNLGAMAFERLLSDFNEGKPGTTSVKRARSFAKISENLTEKSPLSRTILGLCGLFENKELEDKQEGLDLLREWVDKDGVFKPTTELKLFAWGMIGRTLIEKKTDKAYEESVKWLDKCVAEEELASKLANERGDSYLRLRVWGNRYNGLCSLAKLGRKQEALDRLGECLALGVRMTTLDGSWQQYFEHVWYWDEDLDELRKEAGFMDIVKEHAPEKMKFVDPATRSQKEEKYDFAKRRTQLDVVRKKRAEAKKKAEEAKKNGEDEEQEIPGAKKKPGDSKKKDDDGAEG
ncbi:MAG: hypothetical protein GY946_23125 [bacterium]|nr:hypothetical protein [bacterium]